MNIRIEVEPELEREEIIIRCKDVNQNVMEMQKAICEISLGSSRWEFTKQNKKYYLELKNILFFETSKDGICVHTKDDMYHTEYKLYELEERLPGYFMRISKSTILNLDYIYAITRNITSFSTVEFQGTEKQVYVSRSYYKALQARLEERRLRW